MNKRSIENAVVILGIILIGAFMCWAGSQGSLQYPRHGGEATRWPIFAACGVAAFVINWIAFVPAYVFQTERYFDLMGSATYLSIVAAALLLGTGGDPRTTLIAAFISAWAIRLGTFLFFRIRADGFDGRFDKIKPYFSRFLMTWTLQGLWVLLTISCGLAAMTSKETLPLGPWAIVGSILWVVGLATEALADKQKREFRAEIENEGDFISTGLWALSQHPNYLGEIILWTGIALIAFPVLEGWQYATLISPLFVYVLLTRVSGIPLLDARGDDYWGEEPDYIAYRTQTPVLFPWWPAPSPSTNAPNAPHEDPNNPDA